MYVIKDCKGCATSKIIDREHFATYGSRHWDFCTLSSFHPCTHFETWWGSCISCDIQHQATANSQLRLPTAISGMDLPFFQVSPAFLYSWPSLYPPNLGNMLKNLPWSQVLRNSSHWKWCPSNSNHNEYHYRLFVNNFYSFGNLGNPLWSTTDETLTKLCKASFSLYAPQMDLQDHTLSQDSY